MKSWTRWTAVFAMMLTSSLALARGEACLPDNGNPPRPMTASLQGTLAGLYPVGLSCIGRGGEVLTFTDPDGTPRMACLLVPRGTTVRSKRPLVTFLGGSVFPGEPQSVINELGLLSRTADLSGDPARPGFILLIVEGRDKEHYYPFPDDHALGFDNWYRNLNRNDPAINVDVATIDHFITQVQERRIVERKRKYMMGWSNGAAMALLYGMNTRGIAATAVYSSPDPFTDVEDPCPQTPFASNRRPIMTIHNRCDIIGICQTGALGFRQRVKEALPNLPLTTRIINSTQREADSCEAACAYSSDRPLSLLTPGGLFHLRWPYRWNDRYIEFLRANPLP